MLEDCRGRLAEDNGGVDPARRPGPLTASQAHDPGPGLTGFPAVSACFAPRTASTARIDDELRLTASGNITVKSRGHHPLPAHGASDLVQATLREAVADCDRQSRRHLRFQRRAVLGVWDDLAGFEVEGDGQSSRGGPGAVRIEHPVDQALGALRPWRTERTRS